MKRPGEAKKMGARVKARRRELGLSQPKLAELTGISQQQILNIEKGRVERPGRLKELAKALQMTQEEILGETPTEMPAEAQDEPLAFIRRVWPVLPDAIKLKIVGEVAAEVVKMKREDPA